MSEESDLLSRMEQRLLEREEQYSSWLDSTIDGGEPDSPRFSSGPSEEAKVQILELEELYALAEVPVKECRALRAKLWRAWPLFILFEVLFFWTRGNPLNWKAEQLEKEGKLIRRQITRFRNRLDEFNGRNGFPLAISNFVMSDIPLYQIHFQNVFIGGMLKYRKQCLDSIIDLQRQQEKIEELIYELRVGKQQ